MLIVVRTFSDVFCFSEPKKSVSKKEAKKRRSISKDSPSGDDENKKKKKHRKKRKEKKIKREKFKTKSKASFASTDSEWEKDDKPKKKNKKDKVGGVDVTKEVGKAIIDSLKEKHEAKVKEPEDAKKGELSFLYCPPGCLLRELYLFLIVKYLLYFGLFGVSPCAYNHITFFQYIINALTFR